MGDPKIYFPFPLTMRFECNIIEEWICRRSGPQNIEGLGERSTFIIEHSTFPYIESILQVLRVEIYAIGLSIIKK